MSDLLVAFAVLLATLYRTVAAGCNAANRKVGRTFLSVIKNNDTATLGSG